VTTADIAVIGGGIAGAMTAWALGDRASVVVLEAESHPGTHATGRSAAVLTTTTGSLLVRALTVASRPFFVSPPDGFAEVPLSSPRAVLRVGAGLDRPDLERVDGRSVVPVLRDGTALLERDGLDLDVDALLQGCLRGVRRTGGRITTSARVEAIERRGATWLLRTSSADVEVAVVVDAAGAWADAVAALAGVATLGLAAMRRTAFLFTPPDGLDTRGWPLVMDADERWYVKPDAGLLLGSPADETPTDPCDARPEELDVALGIERITEALDLEIRSVQRAWAGLRTFAPDRDPVVGADPDDPTFVWLAGQGGYGIKTAPELGRLAAAAALGEPTPPELSPARFRATGAVGG
jgi:D-arginine dehydrogenase